MNMEIKKILNVISNTPNLEDSKLIGPLGKLAFKIEILKNLWNVDHIGFALAEEFWKSSRNLSIGLSTLHHRIHRKDSPELPNYTLPGLVDMSLIS